MVLLDGTSSQGTISPGATLAAIGDKFLERSVPDLNALGVVLVSSCSPVGRDFVS